MAARKDATPVGDDRESILDRSRDLDDSVLVRPEEAGDWLGVGRSLVFELIAAGELHSVKVGRARRVPVAALRSYVRTLAEA